MTAAQTGQVAESAAAFYERFFVPALFGAFARPVCDAAGLLPGASVLDVACGTGVLTRAAAARVGPDGHAQGIDLNPGMLAMARQVAPEMNFVEGDAAHLPFADGRFDTVVSQFGLMFMPDPVRVLAEIGRVTRPQGRIAVAVWHDLTHFDGYQVLAEIFDDALGSQAGDGVRAPFKMGQPATLVHLAETAGLQSVATQTVQATAHFPSVADFVTIEVKGWVLADSVTDAQLADLIARAEARLNRHVADDGTFNFPSTAIVLSAKPGA